MNTTDLETMKGSPRFPSVSQSSSSVLLRKTKNHKYLTVGLVILGFSFILFYVSTHSTKEGPLETVGSRTTTKSRRNSERVLFPIGETTMKTKSLSSTTTSTKLPPHCGNLLGDDNVYCLPKFIIGGAMKCGTNEAGQLIGLHPRAHFKLCTREQHRHNHSFCNELFYQGVVSDTDPQDFVIWESMAGWLLQGKEHDYFDRFPITDGRTTVSFDKTPEYLSTYKHDYRSVHTKLMKGVKMVFTLCDPAERFVSEFYHHQRKPRLQQDFNKKFTKAGFDAPHDFTDYAKIVLDLNNTDACSGSPEKKEFCDMIRYKLLFKGKYIHGIKDWLQTIPREDLLVIDMTASKEENAQKLVAFAELPLDEYPWEKVREEEKVAAYHNDKIETYTGREALWVQYPEEMTKLAHYYVESNRELANFLNIEFPLRWRSTTTVQ